MKAILWTAYGPPDVLQLGEAEKPTPGADEVLVRVRATTAFAGDCEMRSLKLPILFRFPMRIYVGFRKPKRITILGQELAGEVVSIGRDVKRFKEGDPVFGATGFRLGAYAEYVCLSANPEEGALAIKPANITFEAAAAVPVGGLEALHFIRQGNIRSGQKVLINGAGGSIGTFAVQLAKNDGAEVTAVDSTGKLDMLRSIGADHVIDYTREDFTKGGVLYDVIFDVVGKSPFSGSLRSLKKEGIYLLGNAGLTQTVRGMWASRTGSRRVILGTSNHKTEDLIYIKELIEAGKIKTVIDRSYPFEQMAAAHAYVDTGQKKGNVVITVAPTRPSPTSTPMP
jgi:NADPH:quinone reductase-like Zn-dependent oxidoreductase